MFSCEFTCNPPSQEQAFWQEIQRYNVQLQTKNFERKVGEGGVNDCIRVPSMDQLRNLHPGDEGYIKCLPVYYEAKKKHTGKKQRRILSRGEK